MSVIIPSCYVSFKADWFCPTSFKCLVFLVELLAFSLLIILFPNPNFHFMFIEWLLRGEGRFHVTSRIEMKCKEANEHNIGFSKALDLSKQYKSVGFITLNNRHRNCEICILVGGGVCDVVCNVTVTVQSTIFVTTNWALIPNVVILYSAQ